MVKMIIDGQVVTVPSSEDNQIQVPFFTRDTRSMGPDMFDMQQQEQIMAGPKGGVAGLLGRLGKAFKDNVNIGQSIHDTDISEAMKKPRSVERRRVRDRIFDMLDKGEIPTRDMFLSDEEYRYFLKEYNSIKEFISRSPESLKKRAFKRLRNFEAEVEAAKEGGIRSDRVFDRKAKGYRHPEDSVVDKMLDERITADRLQELKDAAFFSPAAGPETRGDYDYFPEYMYKELPKPDFSDFDFSANEEPVGRPKTPAMQYNQGGRVGYQDGTKLDEILKEDMTISDRPDDPRNMSTERIVGLIKSGRSTPEMFIELMKRGYDVSGGVTELDLSEMGENFKKGDIGYTFDESKIKEGGAIENFLFELREKNPDVFGKYERPMKNYPMDNTTMKAKGGRIGFETGGMDEKGLRQLAIQLARRMNPEGGLSEEDIERAMTIIKNQIEGNTPPESMMIDTTTSAYGDAGRERLVPSFITRDMKQTGGITETRSLPPEYVEALGKTYAADLTRQAGIPSITTATTQQPGETAEQFAQRQAQAQQFGITKAGMADLAPQVAAQDPLQAAAYAQAVDPTTGLGAYQPFLTAAQTAATGATALTGTGAGTGAGSVASYMSPYQQQVIDATLTEFDRQKQIQQNKLAAQTLGIPGAFGGGREGVQRAEYDASSDRNRAAIQSNLLQQGFQQGQAARQQDFANQLGISQLQSGLGARAQDFSRAQISGLGTLGAQQQAQSQAVLDAQRQAAQMAVEDPRRRLSMLGQGVAGLSGLGSVQIAPAEVAPQASPLTTALGLGLAGADIYGRIFGKKS